eukprot:Sspe_Gene.62750::Locus_35449_Transcript_1_1_Confidence_1.000_Length_2716::g.62750::m.62750/K20180/VPS16; vacuolar protein sorting-associated protein 16
MDDSTWQSLGEVSYRREHCYDMKWTVDLGQHMVSAAPYGGPVAITRDRQKIIKSKTGGRDEIHIFTSSGVPISKYELSNSEDLENMGWSAEETLITISKHGLVMVYSLHEGILLDKYIGDVPGQNVRKSVIMSSIFPTGVVALTEDLQLWSLTLDGAQAKMHELGLKSLPSAILAHPPHDSVYQDSKLGVFVFPADSPGGAPILAMQDTVQDLPIAFGTNICRVAISNDGTRVATFNTNGVVSVAYIDFSKVLMEFATKSKEAPNQLLWCGSDCVVCSWLPEQIEEGSTRSVIVLVGMPGYHVSYTYEGPVHLVSEPDCVRVVSNKMCDIIQRVPEPTVKVASLGSTASPALLNDAYQDYEFGKASSVKSIRQLKQKELTEAVDGCIEAAGHEWDKEIQAKLLKAAAYGKCFCKTYDAKKFVDQCKVLRVLNAVRADDIGIPLTIRQYEEVAPEVLIDRLINRRHYLLAYRISTYLNYKTDKVLVHWACAKVKTSKASDEEITRCIVEKFKQCPRISYAGVAATAYAHSKTNLAIRLLDNETKAGEQVPLLIKFSENDRALEKAIESGDTDLIYLVVLRMKRELRSEHLVQVLNANPVARDLLLSYCEQLDPQFQKDFYSRTGMYHQTAMLALKTYFDPRSTDESGRIRLLQTAKEHFAKIPKERGLEAKAMEEQLTLVELKKELANKKNDDAFRALELSIAGVLRLLCKHNDMKTAEKLKKDYNISSKMFTWVKVRGLAEFGHWDELEKFAKSKSPIGYKPFVTECLKRDKKEEAKKYVLRISDYAERCEMLCEVGMFVEAINASVKEGDAGGLRCIRGLTTNPQHHKLIDQYLAQM